MLQTNRMDGAIEAFRECIQIDPGNYEAHFNIATLLLEKGDDLDGAERAYRDAIRTGHPHARMHLVSMLRFVRKEENRARALESDKSDESDESDEFVALD